MEKYEIKYEVGNMKNDDTVYSHIVTAFDESDAKDRFFKDVFKNKKLQNKMLFIDSVNIIKD